MNLFKMFEVVTEMLEIKHIMLISFSLKVDWSSRNKK